MVRSGMVRGVSSAVLVAGAVLFHAAPARAVGGPKERPEGEPATSRVLQLGLGGEYGVKLAGPKLNPWAFGLGVSVGYTLPMGVYVGVPFNYFFGTRDESATGYVELRLWQIGVEGGYDLALGNHVVLRFKAGVGYAAMTQEGCGPTECWSVGNGEPYFGPGLTFLYLGPGFSFTVDARYEFIPLDGRHQLLPSEERLAQGLLFSVGFGF
jgi:hypothetical protein